MVAARQTTDVEDEKAQGKQAHDRGELHRVDPAAHGQKDHQQNAGQGRDDGDRGELDGDQKQDGRCDRDPKQALLCAGLRRSGGSGRGRLDLGKALLGCRSSRLKPLAGRAGGGRKAPACCIRGALEALAGRIRGGGTSGLAWARSLALLQGRGLAVKVGLDRHAAERAELVLGGHFMAAGCTFHGISLHFVRSVP